MDMANTNPAYKRIPCGPYGATREVPVSYVEAGGDSETSLPGWTAEDEGDRQMDMAREEVL